MNKQLLEKNLFALSKTNPAFCSRLSLFPDKKEMYRFQKTRSGEIIPALIKNDGPSLPLHSTVDPSREGERLVSTLSEEGCLVFLGLGGAFAAESALKRSATKKVLIIEYDYSGLVELFCNRDYTSLFLDHRFRLLCDPQPGETEAFIVNNYLPALDGGIRVFPLRIRTDSDPRFTAAAAEIKSGVDSVSRDYSVQAYFGKRWFSNIIRNISSAEKQGDTVPSIQKALILAAGPSLEEHFLEIKKMSDAYFIAVDTALPALLYAGIEPDAVVSIDCQYLSYHHFFGRMPEKTVLFLDLASPPSVAARTKNRVFFSGGHPLSLYTARYWRSLPIVDTSGGNVTYAALSLAEKLGARETLFFGADFSYPKGKTYARGTYLYPYFEKRQSRYAPLEAQHSALLYRDSSLKKYGGGDRNSEKNAWYYETGSLRFYREKLCQKKQAIKESLCKVPSVFSSGPVKQSAAVFLEQYKKSIENLHSFTQDACHEQERELAATLLPLAAFFRRIDPSLKEAELFNRVQTFCLDELRGINRN